MWGWVMSWLAVTAIRGSKLVIDGAALGELPGAEIIQGLATATG